MSIRKSLNSFKKKIIKHQIINNLNYIVLFNKFRFPYTLSEYYIKINGFEVRRKTNNKKAENDIDYFSFEKIDPLIAFAMEGKITPDMKKHYCEQKGYRHLKYFPNLTNPTTFNEKLLWLAVYYKNPIHSIACDKAKVKEWISDRLGQEYVVPSIGVYDDVNDIDFDCFPDKFVIKANNGWGSKDIAIIRNKRKCNTEELKAIVSGWLYPWKFYCYNNLCITDEKPEKPQVVAEILLEQENRETPDDYKVYCCNGKVEFTLVVSGRSSKNQTNTFLDRNWNLLPVSRPSKRNDPYIKKPENYDYMIFLAEKLAKGIPFVRIDMYNIDGKIYIGEMTFTPGLFLRFSSKEEDIGLGRYLDISSLIKQVNTK